MKGRTVRISTQRPDTLVAPFQLVHWIGSVMEGEKNMEIRLLRKASEQKNIHSTK